ncbi:MAG: hypothetical protein FWD30_02210 [Dehalococcoidia bacterium]|nr:hypothetical protein [Dehalococcoidia bacterium]
MKRKLLALAFALVLALSLVACGGGGGGGNGGGGSSDKFDYDNGGAYVASHLTGNYSITYRYTYDGDDYLDVTFTKTSAGYFYGLNDSGFLYIKNGDKFDTYWDLGDGFEKSDFFDPITENEVMEKMLFFNWMWYYDDYSSDMKKDGTQTIAGRNCDKYTYQIAGWGVAYKQVVCIDKQTGVCLKWAFDMASVQGSGSFSFECTEFKTSGVTLPAYN